MPLPLRACIFVTSFVTIKVLGHDARVQRSLLQDGIIGTQACVQFATNQMMMVMADKKAS